MSAGSTGLGALPKVVQVHPVSAPPVPFIGSANTHRVPTWIWVFTHWYPVLHSCGGSWEVPNGLKAEKTPA